ncbi:MAG TPA: GAF domain-containing protein [Pyrinomonadaceae bacterium]
MSIPASPSPPIGNNSEETLTAVCKAAVKLVGVDHSGLVLFENNLEFGTVCAEYPPARNSAVGRRVQIRGIPLEEQLAERKPFVVNDVRGEVALGTVRDLLLDVGVGSILVVPIVVGDAVKGSFSFDSTSQPPRFFDDDDKQKCVSLAEFASLVIENADLLNNVQALQRAMLAIAYEQERDALLKAIIEQAVILLQAEGGGIDELDERSRELTIVAQFEMSEDIVGKKMKVGEGLAGRIIQENLDHKIVKDYATWEGRAPYFRTTDLEALIGVPLRLHGKPTGVIWLNVPNDREYTESDIKLLKGLAGPASIALEQLSLRDAERRKAARLNLLANATNEIFGNLAISNQTERLRLIGKHAHEIIDAELCGIFLVEKPGWLKLVAGHGYKEGHFQQDLQLEIISAPDMGLTGHIAATGDVVRLCGDELLSHPTLRNKTGTADYIESGRCFSVMGIPLKTKSGKLQGLLSIHNKRDQDGKPNEWTCFTNDDQAIGVIFAQAALVAIETADLLDEIRRGQERYKTVLRASNLVVSTKVPDKGLRALAEMVMNVIRRSFCRILFYDPVGETIQVVAAEKGRDNKGSFDWEQRLGEKTPVNYWPGLRQSLETGTTVVQKGGTPDSEFNLDRLSELLKLRDEESKPLKLNYLLWNPLRVQERIIGLLIIGELDENSEFSQTEIDMVEHIARQASLALEKVQRDKEVLQNFFVTEREITASTNPSEALRKIAAQVYQVGRAYGRKVTIADVNLREGDQLRVVAAFPEEQLDQIRSVVGDSYVLNQRFGEKQRLGIVGRVFRDGESIRESAVQFNLDYVEIHPDTLSQLAVPIRDGIETIGVISVESSEPSAFDEYDQMLVETIARLAWSVISRERDLREKQDLLREKQKLQTMATAGAASQFWSHELKHASQLIVNQADKAGSMLASPEIKSILARIRTQAHYIQELHFTPLSSEGVFTENLNPFLEEYLGEFKYDSEQKDLGLTVEWMLDQTQGRDVRINQSWFQKALSFFLDNAREAASAAEEKRIEIRTESLDDSRCRIHIRNTGKKILEHVWDKMGVEKIPKGTGTSKGTGIMQADLILSVYGGKFEKISNEENNIVVAVNLPLVPLASVER